MDTTKERSYLCIRWNRGNTVNDDGSGRERNREGVSPLFRFRYIPGNSLAVFSKISLHDRDKFAITVIGI